MGQRGILHVHTLFGSVAIPGRDMVLACHVEEHGRCKLGSMERNLDFHNHEPTTGQTVRFLGVL